MMKGNSPNASEKRRYIKLFGAKKTDGLGFPDEYFEDEEPEEFEDFLLGLDDDGVARKAKNESILGKVCFISGMVVAGGVLVGAMVLVSRVVVYPLVKSFAKKLDW